MYINGKIRVNGCQFNGNTGESGGAIFTEGIRYKENNVFRYDNSKYHMHGYKGCTYYWYELEEN